MIDWFSQKVPNVTPAHLLGVYGHVYMCLCLHKCLCVWAWLIASLFYLFFYFTILYWFCHTSTCIRHRCTCVPHPEPPSHIPPHTIPLGHPSAPAPSILCPVSNLDWRFVSYMILYMFQCHSPKSSHPLPLPQSPKDCSTHLCLFQFINGIHTCWFIF